MRLGKGEKEAKEHRHHQQIKCLEEDEKEKPRPPSPVLTIDRVMLTSSNGGNRDGNGGINHAVIISQFTTGVLAGKGSSDEQVRK